MQPFFSIIVPVYNVAPYLRECLDSVLDQTFTDWEAICVDDGSTDGSGAILDEYAARDHRFRAIHQINAGVSTSRNVGIDSAIGKYITFLDGDDVYEPFWLEAFRGLIDETNADLVRLRMKTWNGDRKPAVSVTECRYRALVGNDEVVDWGYATYCAEGWSWLNAIKRACLMDSRGVRFPAGMKFMEDNVFMLKVLPLIHKAIQGEAVGYLYRQRPLSVCGGHRDSSMIARLFVEIGEMVPHPVSARKDISWMLGRSVLDWRKHQDRSEKGADSVVLGHVISAIKTSLIHLPDLPARWRFGFFATVVIHSFLVIDVLLFMQRIWGATRRFVK